MASVQLASDAFYAAQAAPKSFVRYVPRSFGRHVYHALARLAPAPYVEDTLAEAALDAGDADVARRYATRLPSSAVRDDLLARAALAQHEPRLAFEYFIAAPDIAAVQSLADVRAQRDPADAYRIEELLYRRIQLEAAHPDALAASSWRLGLFANESAWRQVPGGRLQRDWLRAALRHFLTAANMAPLSDRYAIAAANQADLLGDELLARSLFARAAAANPGSADAIAGLGIVAYRGGDRASARRYLARAQGIDSQALMVRALERDLR